MPRTDTFNIAADFALCEYCGKTYADTGENFHRIKIGRDGKSRIYIACVNCIEKAKNDKAYDDYMTDKTFSDCLGRLVKNTKKDT